MADLYQMRAERGEGDRVKLAQLAMLAAARALLDSRFELTATHLREALRLIEGGRR